VAQATDAARIRETHDYSKKAVSGQTLAPKALAMHRD
jgi:hypothetical protein